MKPSLRLQLIASFPTGVWADSVPYLIYGDSISRFQPHPPQLHWPGDALMPSLLFGGNRRDGRNADETQAQNAERLGALASWLRQLKAYRSLVKDQLLGRIV